MKRNKVKQFYDCGSGEELIRNCNYSSEIIEYLKEEKKVISVILKQKPYEGMLEVGCMNGRNLDIACDLDISYIGIDLVKRFILQTNQKIKSMSIPAIARQCDVKSLYKISNLLSPKILSVFPFNSFGNIDEPVKALKAVCLQNLDSLILTYKTDKLSTDFREEYLINSGMRGLKMKKTGKGVLFTSIDDLCSYAYSEKFIRQIGTNAGYNKIQMIDFSRIGRAYYLSF